MYIPEHLPPLPNNPCLLDLDRLINISTSLPFLPDPNAQARNP